MEDRLSLGVWEVGSLGGGSILEGMGWGVCGF